MAHGGAVLLEWLQPDERLKRRVHRRQLGCVCFWAVPSELPKLVRLQTRRERGLIAGGEGRRPRGRQLRPTRRQRLAARAVTTVCRLQRKGSLRQKKDEFEALSAGEDSRGEEWGPSVL